jgi:hypothetical protein
MIRKAIIKDRRFWWLYPETGRMERIYINERVRAHLSQMKAVEARLEAEQSTKRTYHPPRPPGTKPTLPPVGGQHNGLTLSELAHQYGWGSVPRFTTALKAHRPEIYNDARAVGRGRSNFNLTGKQSAAGGTNEHQ